MSEAERGLIACLRTYFLPDGDDGACFLLHSDVEEKMSGWLVVQVNDSSDAEALNGELKCSDGGEKHVASKSDAESNDEPDSVQPKIMLTAPQSSPKLSPNRVTVEVIKPTSHPLTLQVIVTKSEEN